MPPRGLRAKPKEQYHHFIPRFVLRRFQVEGHAVLNRIERNKAFRKTGVAPEYVNFYSLATGTLQKRAIQTVYGVKDLYKDVTQSDNVYKVEEDLSKLEQQAARIIADLHKSLPSGNFRLKRRDLNQLRKFFFIMHYRRPNMASTYFSEHQPDNAQCLRWIEKYRKTHGLPSSADMWLHVLRYYLDTEHQQLLLDAEETMKKHGGTLAYHLKLATGGEVDPDDKHHEAVAYDKQANLSFLGIWQAADGEEFILGENSFGLWEGLVAGQPEVHRLFLVSSTVVLVLRTNFLRPELFQRSQVPHELLGKINSDLFHIPVSTPDVEYHNIQEVSGVSPEKLNQYRATKGALEDVFKFKITKLTSAQTFAVNRVFMINVCPTGSLTFISKEFMLKTLRAYMSDPQSLLGPFRYESLLKRLDPTTIPNNDSVPYLEPHEMIDIPLFTMVIKIVTELSTYASRFERAFTVLMHLMHNKALKTEFLSDHHSLVFLLRSGLITGPDEAPPSRFRTHAEATVLLKRTPNHVHDRIFDHVLHWGVTRTSGFGHNTDPLSRLQDEVAVIGFVDWTARRHPGVYQTLLDGTHPLFHGQTLGTRVTETPVSSETPGKTSDAGPKQDAARSINENLSVADELLSTYLYQLKTNQLTFRSDYDRAVAVYQRATADENMKHPLTSFLRETLDGFKRCIIAIHGSTPRPRKRASDLVESCSRQTSRKFVDHMSQMAVKFGYSESFAEGGILATLLRESVLFGLASLLGKEQPDFFKSDFQEAGLDTLILQT